jgi:hypothetical protein
MIFFKELLEISRKLKKVEDSLYFAEYPKLSFNTDIKIDESLKLGGSRSIAII